MGTRTKFYAVVIGKVDEPTIFSSWAEAQPRVDKYKGAKHKSFDTLDGAREYMRENGVADPKEVVKPRTPEVSLSTPMQKPDTVVKRNTIKPRSPKAKSGSHAVANGRQPGVKSSWNGRNGTKSNVETFPGACFKTLDNEAQAKAFVKDWRQGVAERWCSEIKEAVAAGYVPRNATQSMKDLLFEPELDTDFSYILDGSELGKLTLRKTDNSMT